MDGGGDGTRPRVRRNLMLGELGVVGRAGLATSALGHDGLGSKEPGAEGAPSPLETLRRAGGKEEDESVTRGPSRGHSALASSLPPSLTSSPLKHNQRLAGSRLLTWTPDKAPLSPASKAVGTPPRPATPLTPLTDLRGPSPHKYASSDFKASAAKEGVAPLSRGGPMDQTVLLDNVYLELEALETEAREKLKKAAAIRQFMGLPPNEARAPSPTHAPALPPSPPSTFHYPTPQSYHASPVPQQVYSPVHMGATRPMTPVTTMSPVSFPYVPMAHSQPMPGAVFGYPVVTAVQARPFSFASSPFHNAPPPPLRYAGSSVDGSPYTAAGHTPHRFHSVPGDGGGPYGSRRTRLGQEERSRASRAAMTETFRRLGGGGVEREGVTTRAIVQLIESAETSAQLCLDLLTDAQVRELVREREGSRWLQKRLDQEGVKGLERLCKVLLPEFGELVNHRYANYVLQKMIECREGREEEGEGQEGARSRERMLDEVVSRLPRLAEEMHGCRVLQRALTIAAVTPAIRGLLGAMAGHVFDMIKSQFGNHVVQKVIDILVEEEERRLGSVGLGVEAGSGKGLAFVVEEVTRRGTAGLTELATNVYGCRVLQKLLQESPRSVRVAEPLAALLEGRFFDLSIDEYGNYVVQHLMARADEELADGISGELMGRVLVLAQHEHASHVVERAVLHSSAPRRRQLIDELLHTTLPHNLPSQPALPHPGLAQGRDTAAQDSPGTRSALELCLMDQYGNYVVQVMLRKAEADQRAAMVALVRRHRLQLSKYTFGQQILARLDSELASPIPSPLPSPAHSPAKATAKATAHRPKACLLTKPCPKSSLRH